MSVPLSPVTTLEQVMEPMQRLFDGVRREQWNDSTPCTDWNVRELMNHVVVGNRHFAEIARGTREGRPSPEERSADHLGDDPSAAYRETGAELLAAFNQPGFLGTVYQGPLGPQPGAGLVEVRIEEQLVHGWDLARATDQKPDFPEDVAEQTLAGLRVLLGGRPRQQTPFLDPQPVADDAPALDRLAAFLGRPV